MRKRQLKLDNYGISDKRVKELSGFCEQYPDWKVFLANNVNTLRSKKIDGMPYSNTGRTSDQTASLAIKRAEIQSKVDLIESTAKEASPELWEYIIKSVCYEMPYWYIRDIMNAPIGRSLFYDTRRYFFWLLDKKR